ncbi:MAG: VCBS repeat-containing protein [Gemmatimonadetes bacterium]|nr:VCBS repeat-containing protein [Gemmatimonadota bacterium]
MRRVFVALALGWGTTGAAQGVPGFTRAVNPFPVQDSAGRQMAAPFLGGFDVPRPQLVDIDGDGDQDLFVQERSNAVMFFENVRGAFTWRTDAFLDVPVGEWYRFVDLDRDGRVDLLSESPVSYIRAWRNVGTREAAKFVIAVDTLRDSDGAPIPADRQNILNAVDIDCNGRLDLFLGRVAGTVDRFEAVPGSESNGVPRFGLHTERWEGIEVLGPVPGQPGPSRIELTGTRHGANTLGFGDIDGDGDIDLFWGDYFERGLLVFENRGSGCGTPNMREGYRRFPDSTTALTSGYNAPTTGDIDGDGLLDVVMGVIGGSYSPRTTAVNNLYLIQQRARGRFEVASKRLVPTLDVGSEATPVLGDVDGDGDLDLLVGNKISPESESTATVTWFENTGTPKAPMYRDRGLLPIRGEFHYAPSVADLDGDGRMDLVMGTWRDRVQWWRNVATAGAPRYELADSALVVLTRGSNTTPALADLDGDGDLDMIVGEASGQLNFYRNAGTRAVPRFELVSDTWLGIDVGRRSTPVLYDVDGDGASDLVLGSEDGGVQWWRNTSAGGAVSFGPAAVLEPATDLYSAPALGDVDGDGVLDLVVGGQSGGLRWFAGQRRRAPGSETPGGPPVRAPGSRQE